MIHLAYKITALVVVGISTAAWAKTGLEQTEGDKQTINWTGAILHAIPLLYILFH